MANNEGNSQVGSVLNYEAHHLQVFVQRLEG